MDTPGTTEDCVNATVDADVWRVGARVTGDIKCQYQPTTIRMVRGKGFSKTELFALRAAAAKYRYVGTVVSGIDDRAMLIATDEEYGKHYAWRGVTAVVSKVRNMANKKPLDWGIEKVLMYAKSGLHQELDELEKEFRSEMEKCLTATENDSKTADRKRKRESEDIVLGGLGRIGLDGILTAVQSDLLMTNTSSPHSVVAIEDSNGKGEFEVSQPVTTQLDVLGLEPMDDEATAKLFQCLSQADLASLEAIANSLGLNQLL